MTQDSGKALTPEELQEVAGMPHFIAAGYINARRRSGWDKEWSKVRAIIDEKGREVAGDDPIKQQRVNHFNDTFMDKLKRKYGV